MEKSYKIQRQENGEVTFDIITSLTLTKDHIDLLKETQKQGYFENRGARLSSDDEFVKNLDLIHTLNYLEFTEEDEDAWHQTVHLTEQGKKFLSSLQDYNLDQ